MLESCTAQSPHLVSLVPRDLGFRLPLDVAGEIHPESPTAVTNNGGGGGRGGGKVDAQVERGRLGLACNIVSKYNSK